MILSVATTFTLIRLFISPVLLPFLIVYLLPYGHPYINGAIALLFAALSLTDVLDGYFARKYNQTSHIGAALDHIADKFLVMSALIALLAINRIYFLWVIIFIGRDLYIMALRSIALELNTKVSVSYLGKMKTACLLIFLTWLIAIPSNSSFFYAERIELILLTCSLLLTILSALSYTHAFIKTAFNTQVIEPPEQI